jgi:hypothetical protein
MAIYEVIEGGQKKSTTDPTKGLVTDVTLQPGDAGYGWGGGYVKTSTLTPGGLQYSANKWMAEEGRRREQAAKNAAMVAEANRRAAEEVRQRAAEQRQKAIEQRQLEQQAVRTGRSIQKIQEERQLKGKEETAALEAAERIRIETTAKGTGYSGEAYRKKLAEVSGLSKEKAIKRLQSGTQREAEYFKQTGFSLSKARRERPLVTVSSGTYEDLSNRAMRGDKLAAYQLQRIGQVASFMDMTPNMTEPMYDEGKRAVEEIQNLIFPGRSSILGIGSWGMQPAPITTLIKPISKVTNQMYKGVSPKGLKFDFLTGQYVKPDEYEKRESGRKSFGEEVYHWAGKEAEIIFPETIPFNEQMRGFNEQMRGALQTVISYPARYPKKTIILGAVGTALPTILPAAESAIVGTAGRIGLGKLAQGSIYSAEILLAAKALEDAAVKYKEAPTQRSKGEALGEVIYEAGLLGGARYKEGVYAPDIKKELAKVVSVKAKKGGVEFRAYAGKGEKTGFSVEGLSKTIKRKGKYLTEFENIVKQDAFLVKDNRWIPVIRASKVKGYALGKEGAGKAIRSYGDINKLISKDLMGMASEVGILSKTDIILEKELLARGRIKGFGEIEITKKPKTFKTGSLAKETELGSKFLGGERNLILDIKAISRYRQPTLRITKPKDIFKISAKEGRKIARKRITKEYEIEPNVKGIEIDLNKLYAKMAGEEKGFKKFKGRGTKTPLSKTFGEELITQQKFIPSTVVPIPKIKYQKPISFKSAVYQEPIQQTFVKPKISKAIVKSRFADQTSNQFGEINLNRFGDLVVLGRFKTGERETGKSRRITREILLNENRLKNLIKEIGITKPREKLKPRQKFDYGVMQRQGFKTQQRQKYKQVYGGITSPTIIIPPLPIPKYPEEILFPGLLPKGKRKLEKKSAKSMTREPFIYTPDFLSRALGLRRKLTKRQMLQKEFTGLDIREIPILQ